MTLFRNSTSVLMAAAVFCVACNSRGADTHQNLRIEIKGGGRDVDARFQYVCRMAEAVPGSGAVAYRPLVSSLLYTAPNGQGLLIGSSNVKSDSLCINDPRQLSDSRWQTLPSLVWLDNVESPRQLDIVNSASVSLARQRHFLPELRAFEVRTDKASPTTSAPPQRQQAFADTLSSLDRPEDPGAAKMISPAHLYIAVDAPSDRAVEQIEAILGGRGEQRAIEFDICKLLRFRDGQVFFEARYPAVSARCAHEGRGRAADAKLKFSAAQGLKRLSGTTWARTDSPSEVESFIRDDASPIFQQGEGGSAHLGKSPSFWKRNVTSIRWITPTATFELPGRSASAFYVPTEKAIVVFLADVRVLRFPGFKSWRKL